MSAPSMLFVDPPATTKRRSIRVGDCTPGAAGAMVDSQPRMASPCARVADAFLIAAPSLVPFLQIDDHVSSLGDCSSLPIAPCAFALRSYVLGSPGGSAGTPFPDADCVADRAHSMTSRRPYHRHNYIIWRAHFMTLRIATFTGLLMLGSMLGCGAVQNAVDCNGICNRYKTCFDSKYDVDKCESNCRDNANSNKNYMNDVSDCNNCIDDKSCASATFSCATPCASVVP